MYFRQISEPKLAQNAYLIGCQREGIAIIVDPLRDIDRYLRLASEDGFTIVAATETHIHADYLSGLRQFAELPQVKVYASDAGDQDWKYRWLTDSGYDYQLVNDGSQIKIGDIVLTVKTTPGHTPEHVAFLVTDAARDATRPMGIITGDFVFVGDVGRPDLLETVAGQVGNMVPSASVLFDSLQDFKHLSPDLLLWPGHGAGSACGKSLGAAPASTVGYELKTNRAVLEANDRDRFISHILDGQPEPPAYFARMKDQNRAGPPLLGRLPQPRSVEAAPMGQWLKKKDFVIVDTRPWEHFRDGHIPGSLFVPPKSAVSTLVGSYVDPESTVCLIADESCLDEMVRHCVRVGVDKIECYLPLDQLPAYASTVGELATVDEIDMAELANRVDRPEALLLDVRRASELSETGRIGVGMNIAHTQLRLRHRELPTDHRIHVYCRTANRSRYAAAFLANKGYDVTHVSGGIEEWLRLGRPVEPA